MYSVSIVSRLRGAKGSTPSPRPWSGTLENTACRLWRLTMGQPQMNARRPTVRTYSAGSCVPETGPGGGNGDGASAGGGAGGEAGAAGGGHSAGGGALP